MFKKIIFTIFLGLMYIWISFWNSNVKIINNSDNILTRNVSYNITIIKKNFYHNNIPIWNIIQQYIKWFNKNIYNYILIKNHKWWQSLTTTPIISLLNWFLTIESWIDNFWWRIIANDYFKLTSPQIFKFINNNINNKRLNLLDGINLYEKQEYYYSSIHKNNISYCNLWNIIPNKSNLIYLRNWKDISLQIETKNNKKRNKIWQKIAMCKVINQFLLNFNYRKNLYYILNAKTSYVGAVLPFQMMPNNLYYYLTLYKQKHSVSLWDISFYYKFISLFLFWEDYNKNIVKYNKHFKTAQDLKDCIKSIRFDPYCIYIKKQIFRYNHANWYVKKVMNKAYNYQLVNDLWLFISPIKNLFIYKNNILYIYKHIKSILQLKYHRINISIPKKNIGINDSSIVWLVYNILNPMDCYYIPYDDKFLKKDNWNIIFCKNKRYWILYWNITNVWKWLSIKKENYFPKDMIDNLKNFFQKKSYNKWLNLIYYKLWHIQPWKIIAYKKNDWLSTSYKNKINYSLINLHTWKVIYSKMIFNVMTKIKYYK